ncbi:MAG: GGDEF domain-containing protein [Granulosicoccus sp.]|nr:GGDEF domain-containing protein [Granulosicoccus sp.]
MITQAIRKIGWDPRADFRAKATFGVATAAVILLFPVAIIDILFGDVFIGIGSLGIVFILAANAWMVAQGRCHQNLTLFGLIPAGMVFMIGVFQSDGFIGSLWCYPSLVACYCLLSERKAWIGNLIILSIALPMAWLTLDAVYAIRVSATLCALSLFCAIMVSVIDEQRKLLQKQLVLDPLTGLLNRFTFNDRMEQAVTIHADTREPVSLLAIDIDHFKQLNDRYGHAAGDQVLRRVGSILRELLRRDDVTFRMGGEEFTVLLDNTDHLEATDIANRIRRRIADSVFPVAARVTVSIGVSTYRQGEHWEKWAKRGDDRLYTAKNMGRNVVEARKRRDINEGQAISLP